MLNVIGRCSWGNVKKYFYRRELEGNLTAIDHNRIKEVLAKGHYIILIRRSTHLTTYLISLGHFVLQLRTFVLHFSRYRLGYGWPKLGYWSHALINVENTETTNEDDFILVEAIGKGVKASEFLEVFDCDAVKIIAPISEITGATRPWEIITEKVFEDVGKKYDLFFDMDDASTMSCVEFVYDTLKNDSLYKYDFEELTQMIEIHGNLDPEMFAMAKCFKTVLEIRR